MRHTLSENPARMKQLAVRVFGVEEAGKTDKEVALEGIDKLSAFWTSLGARTVLLIMILMMSSLTQLLTRLWLTVHSANLNHSIKKMYLPF